jgi:hypothetical protein
LQRYRAKGGFQIFQPRTGSSADADDRSTSQERFGNQFLSLCAYERQQLVINCIGFGNYYETVLNTEEPADVEVFTRLRHYAFVSRDDQRHKINPMRAREHVLYESFVAGNIYEPYANIVEIEFRKSQIDGDPPTLLFRQAVGVDSRQGANKRGLAVVDVPGGSDDYTSHDLVSDVAFRVSGIGGRVRQGSYEF